MKKILPFYMTYPLQMTSQAEDKMMEDWEYLQQMYPVKAKKYSKRINDILDKMDYDGSIIYDAYPDRWQLHRLSQTIMEILMKEEMDMQMNNWMHQEESSQYEEMQSTMMNDLIEVLLYYEILKRRQRKNRGMYNY